MTGLRFDLAQLGLDLELESDDEIVRIFMSKEQGNLLLIQADAIGEPFILGMLCVDLMKHGARAFAQAKGIDEAEAYQAILAGLMAELKHSTDAEPN